MKLFQLIATGIVVCPIDITPLHVSMYLAAGIKNIVLKI